MPAYPPGVRPPRDRVDAYCDSCGTYDRHPRHTHCHADGRVTHKHMDCCERDGCPDGSCPEILRSSGRAHGGTLIAWLHSEPFARLVLSAAQRGAPWAATAAATGVFTAPVLGD